MSGKDESLARSSRQGGKSHFNKQLSGRVEGGGGLKEIVT